MLAHQGLAYRFCVCVSVEGSRLLEVPNCQTDWWRLENQIRHTHTYHPRKFGILGIYIYLLLFYFNQLVYILDLVVVFYVSF